MPILNALAGLTVGINGIVLWSAQFCLIFLVFIILVMAMVSAEKQFKQGHQGRGVMTFALSTTALLQLGSWCFLALCSEPAQYPDLVYFTCALPPLLLAMWVRAYLRCPDREPDKH